MREYEREREKKERGWGGEREREREKGQRASWIFWFVAYTDGLESKPETRGKEGNGGKISKN
jgi:hypothetical protein